MATTIYAASVSPLEDAGLYRKAYGSASPERRQRVDRYRFDKDRRLSLGAEALLRYGLNEEKVKFDSLHIETNAHGKPYFVNSGLHFNISHSDIWVLCAVSDTEVGCDIEKIRSADIKLAERFFCQEEYRNILGQASEYERSLLFCRYWTLKESFMKATGLGMSLPLNSFCIEPGQRITVRQTVTQGEFSFAEFFDIPGFCCAVCAAGNEANASLKVIDLNRAL